MAHVASKSESEPDDIAADATLVPRTGDVHIQSGANDAAHMSQKSERPGPEPPPG